ncbi:MAG: hypothetical protein RJB13_218 [Pseudomonadota bacterium]
MTNELLKSFQSLSADLPDTIKTTLGSFSWSDRLHSLEQSSDQLTVRFYSDGLDLQAKLAVENYLRENTAKLLAGSNELKVFMERKEKAAASAQTRPAAHSHSHSHQPNHSSAQSQTAGSKRPIAGVRRVIAVASGKGGVGKSTVSVNLALALHNQGYKVGLLDADIYGPSIPMMLGITDDPQVNEANKITPPEKHGLKVMSFGFFAPEESAVIWRGPMVMKALQQFFYDVDWGELDFLVIDLPPGTGDAQLTLVQSLPIAGSVIVTTPQNVALADAVKGIVMFQKTQVPIVGVVENMASYHCPSCGAESHIFGTGGADRVSQKFEVPILGHVPLMPEVRAAGDAGEPLTTVNGHPVRLRFAEIAERTVARLIELEKGV